MKIIRVLCCAVAIHTAVLKAQSLGNAGTIEGVVVDPTGASVPQAQVTVHNPVTGYSQAAVTGSDGSFRLTNLPPNPYHLEVTASGFAATSEDVAIRSSLPVRLKITLTVSGGSTTVNVEGSGADLLEIDPSAHVDVERGSILKMPVEVPACGLSQAITYSTGGVAADANGLYHPLGDHFQSSFMIDGQPITDQQSKIYSTQIPVTAVQSMEVITGTPEAEFGDKSSLVAQVTTRSGLGAGRMFGNVDASYGSFGTTGGSIGLGYGNEKFGNFLALDGVRS